MNADQSLTCEMIDRRAVLCGAASLMTLGIGPSAAANQTEISALGGLVAEWKTAWDNWVAAADQPSAGNYDTPECLHWDAERARLLELIKSHPVRTKADAKALSNFVWVDSDADRSEWPDVPRWALQRLVDWIAAA